MNQLFDVKVKHRNCVQMDSYVSNDTLKAKAELGLAASLKLEIIEILTLFINTTGQVSQIEKLKS